MSEALEQIDHVADRVRRIVLGVAEARCRGEEVTDTDVLARHPDLAADLPDALRFAGVLTAAFDRSGSDGPLDGPLPVLTDEELDAPIELLVPGVPPSIDGYELAEEVGRGGQGVVYRGTERATGWPVAVKVLPGGHFSDARARSRFAREARILYRLRCPGVVTATGHGRTGDGSLYLVMPYVDGVPLDEQAARAAGGDAAVARLFAGVADVVEAVHAAGVVHRDLKPSNVRVDRDGRPHVLDFGLAGSRVADDVSRSLTGSHQILGSLPWASPEQARGDVAAVDARSDVYALGLMLAHAIGGGPPYPVDGPPHEVVDRILHARPRVPGRSDGDPLAAVALRCLAKRPADRYPTAAALADDLRRVAAGGRPVPGGRPRRKAIWLVSAAVVAIAVPAVVFAGGRKPRGTAAGVQRADGQAAAVRFAQATATHGGRPVWVSVQPVTAAQFAAVVGPRAVRHDDPGEPLRVPRADATAFCERLSRAANRPYRLPAAGELAGHADEWSADPPATPDPGRRAFHVVCGG